MRRLSALLYVLLFFAVANGQVADSALIAKGVIYYDSAKTAPGINLVDEGSQCYFLTMKGKIKYLQLSLVSELPDGNLIGCTDSALIKFDTDFNIIWSVPSFLIHHEITSDENGNIYLLSSDFHEFRGATVRFDVVKKYSSDGRLVYKWCTYDHLEDFISVISKSLWLKDLAIPYSRCKNATEYILQYPQWFISQWSIKEMPFCISEFSHFNSIQVLPQNEVAKKIPAFKNGNLLLSFNPYSCYGILNPNTGKIEWAGYLPERTTLHTPLLTAAGTILVFQNSTSESEWIDPNSDDNTKLPCLNSLPAKKGTQNPVRKPASRLWASITEYNPVTNKKVWEYTADSMRADYAGSAQRLPNGNTLVSITLHHKGGRIFEVTPDKKIVWEYISPRTDYQMHTPVGFYRAKRLNLDHALKP